MKIIKDSKSNRKYLILNYKFQINHKVTGFPSQPQVFHSSTTPLQSWIGCPNL